MPANLENSVVAIGLEKLSFHSNPKKGNAKEWSNYRTIALISQAGKVMLKFFQARLQQYVNMNFLTGVHVHASRGTWTCLRSSSLAQSCLTCTHFPEMHPVLDLSNLDTRRSTQLFFSS